MRLARGLLLCAAALLAAPVHAGETFKAVKARGTLRCGVSEGIAGFSSRDATGRWVGMDAEFCRAVAAAALGSGEKVSFIPLTASRRFPALQAGSIDILVRQTTWTLARESGLKVRFAGILLYDGQGFMVPGKSAVSSVAALDGSTVCVEKGTTHADNLAEYFATNGWRVSPLVLESSAELAAAFRGGRCQAYSSDVSQLSSLRASTPGGAQDYVILKDRISKEPIGPVVRAGDEEWLTLVRWVLFMLVAAEEQGITGANAANRMSTPAAIRAIGAADEFSQSLGVERGWALRAVQSGGNYGEIFERSLGGGSPLKLERGPNRPWTQGGLMYAPPIR
ncbi:amino acid ABC transporter substrate-binding protein [Ramlibacter sp. PS3R-8]|uniref:amino acid ABC transporter substrate-binding protein n=1 Tax=Ramlibacter sp. PS3R-8 TaxID=3133437 RepID=UPI0030B099B5